MSRESALLALALLAACARDWRTDMWYQPARQARETPRPEPAGSVPLFARLHLEDRDDAVSLRPPFPDDDASADRGRALFLDRCAGCHNVDGHGKGPVGRTFPPAPDLALDTIKAKSDGYIYGTIAMGGKSSNRTAGCRTRRGPNRFSGPAHREYIGSVRMLPAAV